MEYTIQNGTLQVTASTLGAELQGILHQPTGTQLLWQGDKAIWGGRAPLLFPHCGMLAENILRVNNKKYPSTRHGFARTMQFALEGQTDTELRFLLQANEATMAVYPYNFALRVIYSLEGQTLRHTVEVDNPSGALLPFTVGYHPAFMLHAPAQEYEFRFEKPESPVQILTPGGLVSGQRQTLFQNRDAIPLADDMFAEDSICMAGLSSNWLMLRHKTNPGLSVTVNIAGFPYVLLWGPMEGPLPFVCIEPWHSVPDPVGFTGDFANKPGITLLAPGEGYTTSLTLQFGEE